jgi:two-component system sensor histidine kinase DegS
MRSCIREFRERSDENTIWAFHTNCGEEDWLPDDIAICLYRILSEALINIEKHANARQVRVSLMSDTEEAILTIEDDGCGFIIPQNLGELVAEQHFGIVTMRERLELVQGSLEIETDPGKGARIRARVPLYQSDMSHALLEERAL